MEVEEIQTNHSGLVLSEKTEVVSEFVFLLSHLNLSFSAFFLRA